MSNTGVGNESSVSMSENRSVCTMTLVSVVASCHSAKRVKNFSTSLLCLKCGAWSPHTCSHSSAKFRLAATAWKRSMACRQSREVLPLTFTFTSVSLWCLGADMTGSEAGAATTGSEAGAAAASREAAHVSHLAFSAALCSRPQFPQNESQPWPARLFNTSSPQLTHAGSASILASAAASPSVSSAASPCSEVGTTR